MVEETPRGRWFCSPNVRVGLLDYLFAPSDSGDTQSKLILRAISWLRDNEERRKYFFERDGDARYSGVSLLRKLWPWGRVTQTAATGETTAGAGSDGDTGTRERAGGRQDRTERPPRTPQPTTPRIVTPHEILGVPPDATVDVITQRFHRLAVQYHPDKVHHLGEEFREVAHVKFVELQRAYRSLVDEARRKK